MACNIMLQWASLMGKTLPGPLGAEGWRKVVKHHAHSRKINVILKEARMACTHLHLFGLFAGGEWLARSVVKNSLTADRGPRSYHIGDLCAVDVQPIAELAGVELDPLLLALQPYAVKAHYEQGPFPLSASMEAILAALDHLRHEAVALLGEG